MITLTENQKKVLEIVKKHSPQEYSTWVTNENEQHNLFVVSNPDETSFVICLQFKSKQPIYMKCR